MNDEKADKLIKVLEDILFELQYNRSMTKPLTPAFSYPKGCPQCGIDITNMDNYCCTNSACPYAYSTSRQTV